MPSWFYPLLLVVILAGYVFLFIQGRMIRRGQAEILNELERRLDRLESLGARAQGPAPASVLTAGPIAPDPRLGEEVAGLRTQLLDQGALLAEQGSLLEKLAESLVTSDAPAGMSPAEPEPETSARRFLLEEGFSRIRFTGREDDGDRTTLRVSAMRGDEVRQGKVVIEQGRPVDASLKIPTALFP